MTDDEQKPMDTQFKGWCTSEQKRRWEKAARKERRSLSDWLRIVADDAADAALAEDEKPKRK